MSNTPSFPDANESFSPELLTLENLGKSFRNVFILIAITFAVVILFYSGNCICKFCTQKALAEISTVFFLICWFGGMIFYLSVVVVLILFLINIWNTPASIVRSGGIGKVLVGMPIAGIGMYFFTDAIPIEYISILDYISIILFIIETIVYLVYMKRLANAVGSSRVNSCMNWLLCGALICITMSLVNTITENLTILTIEYILGNIFGVVSFFSFLLSFYFMSADISAFIDNQRRRSDNETDPQST